MANHAWQDKYVTISNVSTKPDKYQAHDITKRYYATEVSLQLEFRIPGLKEPGSRLRSHESLDFFDTAFATDVSKELKRMLQEYNQPVIGSKVVDPKLDFTPSLGKKDSDYAITAQFRLLVRNRGDVYEGLPRDFLNELGFRLNDMAQNPKYVMKLDSRVARQVLGGIKEAYETVQELGRALGYEVTERRLNMKLNRGQSIFSVILVGAEDDRLRDYLVFNLSFNSAKGLVLTVNSTTQVYGLADVPMFAKVWEIVNRLNRGRRPELLKDILMLNRTNEILKSSKRQLVKLGNQHPSLRPLLRKILDLPD